MLSQSVPSIIIVEFDQFVLIRQASRWREGEARVLKRGDLKMRMLNMLALVALLALGSCSASSIIMAYGGPTPAQITAAQRRPLSPAEQKVVSDSISTGLKDPGSAQFKFPPIAMIRTKNNGIAYCVLINAKNSYGGYVGFSYAYMIVFTDSADHVNEVHLISLASPDDNADERFCRAYGY